MKARVQLKVRAGAKKTGFAGCANGVWKLNVASLPFDGKANGLIIRFLARISGIRQSAIRIVNATASPHKLIEIEGIDNETLIRVILESHGPASNTGSSPPRKD